MNSDYQEQAEHLSELRRSLMDGTQRLEAAASTSSEHASEAGHGADIERQRVRDPMIYPGVYAPSGFDMMGILVRASIFSYVWVPLESSECRIRNFLSMRSAVLACRLHAAVLRIQCANSRCLLLVQIRVTKRPNPTFTIGPVDSSVSLLLCDSSAPDMPIVYCSEPFELLTGYASSEICGRNCRFLQNPYGTLGAICGVDGHGSGERKEDVNRQAKEQLREKIAQEEEARVQLVNYKKGGERFMNLLTTIPISWEGNDGGPPKRYVVGFQVAIPDHISKT